MNLETWIQMGGTGAAVGGVMSLVVGPLVRSQIDQANATLELLRQSLQTANAAISRFQTMEAEMRAMIAKSLERQRRILAKLGEHTEE